MSLKKKLSYRTIPFIFILFLSGNLLHSTDWSEIISRSGPAIGRIQILDSRGVLISQGTGFVTKNRENKQVFVTNAHVIRDAWFNDAYRLSIVFDYGKRSGDEERREYGGEIESYNSNLDLGLVRLDDWVPASLELNEDNTTGLLSELIVAGYPLGKSFKATPGMIQAYQTVEKLGEMIDMSAVLAPGNSGGPVLNNEGKVIGIATAVIQGYNFNFAIPSENLIRFIDAANNTVALEVLANPEGSRVFINGDYKGETPLNLELFNNQYTMRMEKEGFEPLIENIGPWEALSGNSLRRDLAAVEVVESSIRITTDPAGAEIFISNSKIGVSPITVEMTPGRILRIRAKKGPFKKGFLNYRVTDDPEQTVHLELD